MMRNSPLPTVIVTALLIGMVGAGRVSANTSWRGPDRDGIYPEKNLLSSWPENGPKSLFTIGDIGEGFSSPAVTADRIYVTGMIDSDGYLFAHDINGKLLWKTKYGPEWSSSYEGVRGSPLVAGERVYVESGRGRVVCLNAADGKEVWAVEMDKTFGALPTKWGHAETVLLFDNKLICTPGGAKAAVAALDPATGKTIWKTRGIKEKAGYCSPAVVTHNNKKILVTMLSESIIGIDPGIGELLWRHPHKTDHGVNPNTPIYTNGNIVYASGYGNGAGMLKLSDDGTGIKEVWREPAFDVQIGGTVLLGNMLYGFGHKNKGLHALDINTGKITATLPQSKGGAVIAADGLLYAYNERGEVLLVKPEKQELNQISTFPVENGKGPHWAHPVLKDGRLYVRHGAFLMVYAVGK